MKDLEQRKVEQKVLDSLLESLTHSFLESSAPEEMKNEIRLMKKETRISKLTRNIFESLVVDNSKDIPNKSEIVSELDVIFTSFIERLMDFANEKGINLGN